MKKDIKMHPFSKAEAKVAQFWGDFQEIVKVFDLV
jgi:hypothetical protein